LAPPIPTYEPASFIAGDTVQWTKWLSDYPPADGWTLKYRLVGATAINTGNPYTATVSNGLYAITIPAADTASITSDTPYRLIGWVEKGSERHAIIDTVITAFANAATATATQLKTADQLTLETIEAAIAARLTSDGIESYTIDGRSTQLMTMLELTALRGVYKGRVWREQNAGKSFPVHAARPRAAR
jgi:hypothetical protein